jgi:hypothetical protein
MREAPLRNALFVGQGSEQKKYELKEIEQLTYTLVNQPAVRARVEALLPVKMEKAKREKALWDKVKKATQIFFLNGRHFVDMEVLEEAIIDRLKDDKLVETWANPTDHVKPEDRKPGDPPSISDRLATHPKTGGHPEHGKFVAAFSGFLEPDAIEELWLLTLKGIEWAAKDGISKEEKKQNPYYAQLAKRLEKALVVPPGKQLALWSGGYDVSAFAQERGYFTLEVTHAGKVFDQLKLFESFGPLGELWNQFSHEFAQHGRSEIHVFMRSYDPTAVLFKEELPAVLKLQEITDVRWHLLSGKTTNLLEIDDKGNRKPGFTFDTYLDVVAAMPLDAMRNDEVTKPRAKKDPTVKDELTEREQRDMKDEVAFYKTIHEGLSRDLQKAVEARVANYDLDRSYNDNPEELREKKTAVEAIIKTLAVRLQDPLHYDNTYNDVLNDMDDMLSKLAKEMDKKYLREANVRELKGYLEEMSGLDPRLDWESGYDRALNLMKKGASVKQAKDDLEKWFNSVQELKHYAQEIALPHRFDWESGYDHALKLMKAGASLEQAKGDLERWFKTESS